MTKKKINKLNLDRANELIRFMRESPTLKIWRILDKEGAQYQKDLKDKTGLHWSQITRVIDRLSKYGLIKPIQSGEDTARIKYCLTYERNELYLLIEKIGKYVV